MNRNEQGSNEQNRTYSGRENLARRQAGPSASGRVHHQRERESHDRESEPEHLKSRERMRHDHDQNFAHDDHDRQKSFRAQREEHDQDFTNESFNEYPQQGHNLDHRRPRHKDYTGFGPRGYKRSDARIEEELCELLARDHYIDASDIVVAVEEGVVKLSGSVEQREDRVEAEMLAESVIGVEDIQNDISVRRKNKEMTH